MPQRPYYPAPSRHSRHGSEDDYDGDERPRRRRDEERRGRNDDYGSHGSYYNNDSYYNDSYSYNSYYYDNNYTNYYNSNNNNNNDEEEERYYRSRHSQRDRYAPPPPPPDYYAMPPQPPPPSSRREAPEERYGYGERTRHYDSYEYAASSSSSAYERRGQRDGRPTRAPAPPYYYEDREPNRQAVANTRGGDGNTSSYYPSTTTTATMQQGAAASSVAATSAMAYASSSSVFAAPDAMTGQPLAAHDMRLQQAEASRAAEASQVSVVVGHAAHRNTTTTTTTVAASLPPVVQPDKTPRPSRPVGEERQAETLLVRPGATPILVPTTLPIQVSSFLDVLAFYVVQGGPSTEEEIYRREEHNPHFAFLNAKWNDPRLLYYRWRLYSLLQGDTMTAWRTAPFQIEAGARAHVWQPPPLPQSGPEVLLGAFAPMSSWPRQYKRARDEARKTGTEKEEEDDDVYPPPSALWLGHQVVGEGKVFVTLSEEDVAAWAALLDVETILREARASQTEEGQGTGTSDKDNDSNKKRQGYAVLLSREVIATRMVFAIEHSTAAVHVLSLLLDAVLRVTYDCARQLTTKEQPKEDDEKVCAELDKTCYALLGYLFLLHDIARNATVKPQTCTEAELEQMYADYELTGTLPEELTTGAAQSVVSGGGGTRVAPALHTALEMILPTLLEACTLTAMTVLHRTHHLQAEPGKEGEEELAVRCRIKPDASPHCTNNKNNTTDHPSGAAGDKQRVAAKAFLLLHWMKELFLLWSPASVQDTLGSEPQTNSRNNNSNNDSALTASLVTGEASVDDLLKSKLSPQEILRAAAAAELAGKQKSSISSNSSNNSSSGGLSAAALLQLNKRGEQRKRRRVRTAVLSARVSTILAERYGFLLASDEAAAT